MKIKIAVLKGDGIGPEVINEAIKVLQAVAKKFNHQFTFEETLVGATAIFDCGKPLPEKTLEICKDNDAILFGAIGHPDFDNNPNAKVRPEQGLLKLRKSLNLFLNIRPVKAYDTLLTKSPLKENIIKGVDLKIYRELTGGIYFGEKRLNEDGSVASDLCSYSVTEIERVANLAFKAAITSKQKLTLVDKANVLETSRLWRKIVTEIAKQYPSVKFDTMFVDNAAMQLILNPKQFDVVLTSNLFGDILSDLGPAVVGGMGIAPGANINPEKEFPSMFEPVHGSAPDIAGQNIANPIACFWTAVMMLDHFDELEGSKLLMEVIEETTEEGKVLTKDLGGKASTQEMTKAIINRILKK